MKHVLFVRGARQLVTLQGPAGPRRGADLGHISVIPDGSLLIENGVILRAGATRQIESLTAAREAQEIDATGHVVMPAFVDCDTSLLSGPPMLTEFEHQAEAATTGPLGLATASARQLQHQLKRLMGAMARVGTATAEVKLGPSLDEIIGLKALRALEDVDGDPVELSATVICPPLGELFSTGDMLDRLLPRLRQRVIARHIEFYVDGRDAHPEQLDRWAQELRQRAWPSKARCRQPLAQDAIRIASEANAVSLERVRGATEDHARLLSQSPLVVTLLPWHSAQQADDAGTRRLIDQGAAVAIGSGFEQGRNSIFSMPLVAAMACRGLRMSPAEAICAGTINAAYALGWGHRVGSLESGKQADLLMLHASDYRELPYYAGASDIALTMKRGQVVFRS